MALPLKALTVQPIRLPTYLNDRLRDFKLWYADNEAELSRYFNELTPYCEEGEEPLKDFFTFAVIQHEREEMKQLTESNLQPSQADRAPLDLQVPGSRGGVSVSQALRRVFDTSYTLEEPLDPRRDEEPICDNE